MDEDDAIDYTGATVGHDAANGDSSSFGHYSGDQNEYDVDNE